MWLINYCADGPKFSRTCICADDVGSCLRALKHSKIHYSIWKLSARVAGLALKPTKCCIVVTCIPFFPQVKQAITRWLRDENPEWQDMLVVDHAKYLRVFLGVGGPIKHMSSAKNI